MSRKSVCAGISAMVVGASEMTGIDIDLPKPETETEHIKIEWDDEEEKNYREWIRMMQAESTQPVEFDETEAEEAYRARMKEEAEKLQDVQVDWSDNTERMYRQKYLEMRRAQIQEDASWDEQRAEVEYRERKKRESHANRGRPIEWDDADERKCQERYRKKYSKS